MLAAVSLSTLATTFPPVSVPQTTTCEDFATTYRNVDTASTEKCCAANDPSAVKIMPNQLYEFCRQRLPDNAMMHGLREVDDPCDEAC